MTNKIVCLGTKKYEYKIKNMGKAELLLEMILFQEERKDTGYLTPNLIDRGLILFDALLKVCETYEMQSLCSSYLKHLFLEKERLNGRY